MLCEAAHQTSRPTHPLHPYFAKLCAKRGYKMATIAVAHRLARITFAMLGDGTDFEVGKLNVEGGPFERTIIRSYRLTPAARQKRETEIPGRRTQARARDPGSCPEPRAQRGVWGRAPRSATWGEHRPRMDAW